MCLSPIIRAMAFPNRCEIRFVMEWAPSDNSQFYVSVSLSVEAIKPCDCVEPYNYHENGNFVFVTKNEFIVKHNTTAIYLNEIILGYARTKHTQQFT